METEARAPEKHSTIELNPQPKQSLKPHCRYQTIFKGIFTHWDEKTGTIIIKRKLTPEKVDF